MVACGVAMGIVGLAAVGGLGFLAGGYFYHTQRTVNISNEFCRVSRAPDIDGAFRIQCNIVSDWRCLSGEPIRVMVYGAPYEILLSATAREQIRKFELLGLTIYSKEMVSEIKARSCEVGPWHERGEAAAYLKVKDVHVPHQPGLRVKIRYKVRLELETRTIEQECESEFSAETKVEKSFRIIDMWLSA